jgi:hypothetical protein
VLQQFRLREGAAIATIAAFATLLIGCGGDDQSATAPTTVTAKSEPTPTIDRTLQVGSPARELAIRCWGSGRPAVVLDAGGPDGGIASFRPLAVSLIKPLAQRTTVCAYDRAGTGSTASLPNERRTIDDQAHELNELLAAADVPKPRVLVGSSWGGFIVVNTARNHPDGVGGIVLLDVPAGNPANLTAEDADWKHPSNVTRTDALHAERVMARDKRSLGDVPVTVVTANGGQSDAKDQRVWKRLSSNFSQVVLSGGHEIYLDDPNGVVEQILKTVDAAG